MAHDKALLCGPALSPDHTIATPETHPGIGPGRDAGSKQTPEPADEVRPGTAPPDGPSPDNSPPERDYEVGYGKPPKQYQFKKGQSGNPRGAPRKRQVEKADVGAILSKPVPVKTKRGKKLVHPFELMLRNLIRRVLNENHLTSLLAVLEHFEAHGAFADPEKVTGGGVIQAPPGVDLQEWIEEVTEPIPVDEDIADTGSASSNCPASMPEKDTHNGME